MGDAQSPDASSAKSDASGKLKLFVSYSRRDLAFADQLVAALEARQFEVLIDRRDLPALEDWQRELLAFIRKADTVIFVASRASLTSAVCSWEIEQVRALSKRLAPIVIDDITGLVLPPEVAKINYLSFAGDQSSGAGFDTQVDALAAALMTDIAWIKEHTRLGEIAGRWQARNFTSALLLRGRELAESQSWIASRPRLAPEPTELHRSLIAKSQTAARRRQRFAIAASLGVSVVTSALAIFAYVQMNERTVLLSKTVRAATDMVASAADIRDQIGVPSKVILSMLEIPDRSLAAIADQTGGIPDVIRAFARLDYDICVMSIQAGEFAKGVGRCDQGIARMATLAGLEKPTVADSEHVDRLLRMAAAGSQEGGNPQAAERYRRQSEQLVGKLPTTSADATDAILREVRGLSDQGYADIASSEKLPAALANLRKARTLLAGILDKHTENPTLQLEMSFVENRLVEALLSSELHDEALPHARQSVALMDRLTKLAPDDIEMLRHQSYALDGLARAALQTKEIAEARSTITKLAELSAKLAALDPARVDLVSLRPVAEMRKAALARLEASTTSYRPALAAHAEFVSIYKKSKQSSLRLLFLENADDILNDPNTPSSDAFAVLQDALDVELAAVSGGAFQDDVVNGLHNSAEALYRRFKQARLRKDLVASAVAFSKTAPCQSFAGVPQADACLAVADIERLQVGNDIAWTAYKILIDSLAKAPAQNQAAPQFLVIKGLSLERVCQIGVEAILAKKPTADKVEQYCELSAATAAQLQAVEPNPVRLEEEATRYNKGGLACLFQDKYDCAESDFSKGWQATTTLLQQDVNYESPAVDALLRAATIRCTVAAHGGKVDHAYNFQIVADLENISLRRTVDKLAQSALAESVPACPYR